MRLLIISFFFASLFFVIGVESMTVSKVRVIDPPLQKEPSNIFAVFQLSRDMLFHPKVISVTDLHSWPLSGILNRSGRLDRERYPYDVLDPPAK
jgi:hypothetical protein